MKHRLMNSYDIATRFIGATLLQADWKGFWIFRWPETRWTPTMVAEALALEDLCEIRRRNIDGSVSQIWMNKEVSKEEIESLCLGERLESVKKWQAV
jgi:hypothetical protein